MIKITRKQPEVLPPIESVTIIDNIISTDSMVVDFDNHTQLRFIGRQGDRLGTVIAVSKADARALAEAILEWASCSE